MIIEFASEPNFSANSRSSPATHVRWAFFLAISAYVQNTPPPESNRPKGRGVFCGIVVAQEIFTMTSDQARQRAERNFKREERAQDGRKAMIEYEAQAVATRKKTARLKALRLAKEAQAQTDEPPAKQTKRRTARHEKWQLFELRSSTLELRCGLSPATHVCGAFYIHLQPR